MLILYVLFICIYFRVSQKSAREIIKIKTIILPAYGVWGSGVDMWGIFLHPPDGVHDPRDSVYTPPNHPSNGSGFLYILYTVEIIGYTQTHPNISFYPHISKIIENTMIGGGFRQKK